MLYIQFEKDKSSSYSMRYDLKTTSKIPAFVSDLIQLGQIAGIGAAGGGEGDRNATVEDVWGGNGFSIPFVPSDIQVTPIVIPAQDTSVQLDAKKFNDEGRYHIDFSVGVPIKKISDVSYTASAGTLVPSSVKKTDLFALFNYYPKSVDVNSPWSKYPHLLTGVSLASQPLHQTLYAAGYGPAIANFYAGALLNVKQLPKVGGSCSTTPSSTQTSTGLSKHYCTEFSFGLNVSVGVIAQSLKSGKSGK